MANKNSKNIIEEKPQLGITASEDELNELFQETLDGIRDDITEAKQNVDMYFEAVLNETGGKETYGTAYNEALKIKGSARARQLSFLGMFKDRVAIKERAQLLNEAKKDASGGLGFNHSDLNKFIEEYENGVSTPSVKPVITNLKEEIDEDEEDFDDDFEEDDE